MQVLAGRRFRGGFQPVPPVVSLMGFITDVVLTPA